MMIPMYPVISWCYSKIYAVQDYIWWTSSKARSNLAGFHKPTRSFVQWGHNIDNWRAPRMRKWACEQETFECTRLGLNST